VEGVRRGCAVRRRIGQRTDDLQLCRGGATGLTVVTVSMWYALTRRGLLRLAAAATAFVGIAAVAVVGIPSLAVVFVPLLVFAVAPGSSTTAACC
jgi:hypothetical protein